MTRGKIEMKPIQSEDARQVSFSKRRQGMFKKASELSVLCGATVGSVVFSSSGRSYSFGHPSIDIVANRFVNSVTPDSASSAASHDNSLTGTGTVHNLNMEYLELQQSVDSEKKKNDELQEATKKEMGAPMMQWLNSNILEMGLDDLLEYQKWLEAIDGVVKEGNKTVVEASQTEGSATQPPMYIASSSHYQFGEHMSDNSMAFTAPASSSNGFIDGFEVNDPLLSGGDLYDVCGLRNFPNNQNHG